MLGPLFLSSPWPISEASGFIEIACSVVPFLPWDKPLNLHKSWWVPPFLSWHPPVPFQLPCCYSSVFHTWSDTSPPQSWTIPLPYLSFCSTSRTHCISKMFTLIFHSSDDVTVNAPSSPALMFYLSILIQKSSFSWLLNQTSWDHFSFLSQQGHSKSVWLYLEYFFIDADSYLFPFVSSSAPNFMPQADQLSYELIRAQLQYL